MSDTTRITNWPSDASKERVALDLLKYIRESTIVGATDEKSLLSAYTRCLNAVRGHHKD